MKLPKAENWTQRTSERVLKRISKLFVLYENCSEHNSNGVEINAKAIELDSEMFVLWDQIPTDHRPTKSLYEYA